MLLLRTARKSEILLLNIRMPDSIPLIGNVKGKYFEMMDIS